MKDKKNLLLVIVAAVAVSIMIIAVVVLVKGLGDSGKEEETTTKEMTIEDYYQLYVDYLEQKDYAKALDNGYIYLDMCEDKALYNEMCSMIADVYVQFGNYEAAYSLLKDNTDEEFYNTYCKDKVNLEDYLGVYADKEDEEYFYLGKYPQSGYTMEELPEYIAGANFNEDGYAKIYGVEYLKIEDMVYVYEPVRWWKIGEEDGNICLLSECIIDTRSFNQTFGSATWDNSDLREWLNGEFYNSCFDENDKAIIFEHYTPISDNYYHGFFAGEETNDYVSLVPAADLTNGKYVFEGHREDAVIALRQAKGTDYAVANGLRVFDNNCGRWWTATAADVDNLYTVVITELGYVLIESGGEVNNKKDVGVRPFIKISNEDSNATNQE